MYINTDFRVHFGRYGRWVMEENANENINTGEAVDQAAAESTSDNVGTEAIENAAKKDETKSPADDPETGRKGRIGRTLAGIVNSIGETFKNYPLTLFSVMMAALIGALNINDEIFPDRFDDLIFRIIAFCLILALQVLLYEEMFMEKPSVRWTGYILSSAIAAVFVFILTAKDDVIFGIDNDIAIEITYKILIIYGVFMVGLSIYHIFRRLEDDFEVYCTRAFFALIKAGVIYGLFAAGLAIIVFIFNELIFDTDDFLAQLELFLAGGIFTAMCLKAISGKNEEPGKFARVCVYYVLQPMLIIAFAIIYIYIVKIFATDTVPSNQVFGILTFLFSTGVPVWTMMHGMNSEKARRFTKILPFIFIPFIALQGWSMGIRISAYGFTSERYYAVVFMTVEVIYFLLYIIRLAGVKQSVSWLLFVFMIIAPLVLVAPRISCEDVVIASQIKRMEQMMSKGDLNDAQKSAVKSAYYEVKSAGYKGKFALSEHFSDKQLNEMTEYDEYDAADKDIVYIDTKEDREPMDISGYKKMYRVLRCERERGNQYRIIYYAGQDDTEELDQTVDLGMLMKVIGDDCKVKRDRLYDYDLSGKRNYRINDHMDLYIVDMYLQYDTVTGKAADESALDIEGYILER